MDESTVSQVDDAHVIEELRRICEAAKRIAVLRVYVRNICQGFTGPIVAYSNRIV